MAQAVSGLQARDCMKRLAAFLAAPSAGTVCLLYGLRRTGKTTLIMQAIRDLPPAQTAYIKLFKTNDMAMLNHDLQLLADADCRYVFIDEITLMADFIDSASRLSDIYAMFGMKIVLSGTDSLGFLFASDDELYDRAVLIHTTFIPFREYARLLNIHDVDTYIRYGGTFHIGSTDFGDPDLRDESVSFRDDETTRKYIDTAIARNIQHSLACYKQGSHFRHLQDLQEAGELTNAVNRIIEDMNHRFLLSVLEQDFTSHDLGSARQIQRKRAARTRRENPLDLIDEEQVTARLMQILDIHNRAERKIALTEEHIAEIREYLSLLELILTRPAESIEAKAPAERILFTQPGMRYCQAQALVFSLRQDAWFASLDVETRESIIETILCDVRGRLLEEIVLLETIKALPPGQRAFKLFFPVGEIDMVIQDTRDLTCQLFEIKHSDQVDRKQIRHLTDEEKLKAISFRYGSITSRTVLYRGPAKEAGGITYRNVEEYLETLGQ
ncbi:MAG: AAA family ATPase [Firmicutes bacterium]|nr:AAA family ATPase [Bacillota bacterium]